MTTTDYGTLRCCQWCSHELPAGSSARRRYCSNSCRARAGDSRARESGRATEWDAKQRARRPRKPDCVECSQCGSTFERRSNSRRYCSDECRNRSFYDSRVEKSGYRESRARYDKERLDRIRDQSVGAPFTSSEVFERDGFRCYLCGTLCDRAAAVPSPLAATVDHKVPLSRGGEHSLVNVGCAHFACNCRKSDRLDWEC